LPFRFSLSQKRVDSAIGDGHHLLYLRLRELVWVVQGNCSADLKKGRRRNGFGPVWHSSASPVELFFKNNFMSRGELCLFSFTVCLTL
jgi:hypothetical protein